MLRPFLSIFIAALLISCQEENNNLPTEQEHFPGEYMFMQRAFPAGTINKEAYRNALYQAQAMRRTAVQFRNSEPWENAGPTNVGGRITSLAADSTGGTIYAGAASGGVWKTTDDGLNWSPIFDEALTMSIGDLAVARSNADIIYVGTGEANPGGGSLAYDGLGVFKSIDAGENWQQVGLEEVGSIGKVIIHPTDPDIVIVAAMGYLFENNAERGVFKTVDGGLSWEKVLFVNDSTGAIDLAMHPTDPNVIYAATWERIRRPDRRQYGGPGCGIYRSDDGGDSWIELDGGLPQSENGRIGLAVTPNEPDMILALYEGASGESKGVFRSYDKGESWQAPPDGQGITYPGFGWWFGKIYIDPNNKNKVFALGLDTHLSTDGAVSFSNIQSPVVHVDQHALFIDPNDSDRIFLGNDGGVYASYDGGSTWDFRSSISITQFYTCEIDYTNSHRLYGGTQDNGTWRTLSGDLGDYEHIVGGDGFYAVVNPLNPDFILGESQYGGLVVSSNGGNNFQYVGNQISGRKNWNMPVVLDPSSPNVVYAGSHRLYRSINNGFVWKLVSPDLTTGPPSGNIQYSSITSIAVSPQNSNIIWVGTDDGNVQVSTDGCNNWELVSNDLPIRWVTRVIADPYDEATAYVTFSGYRYNEYLPHVFKTVDFGQTWEDISGNLPEAPANDLIIDPYDIGRMYLATDVGVFETVDGGVNWEIMGEGLPIVPITDLCHHDGERFLIAATYGRSLFKVITGDPVAAEQLNAPKVGLSVYPNPISSSATISFHLVSNLSVDVGIYDLQGRLLRQLHRGDLPQGDNEIKFERFDLIPSTYVVRLITPKTVNAVKVVVL